MLRRTVVTIVLFAVAVVSLAWVGNRVTLPHEEWGMAMEAGSLNATMQQVLGKPVTADLLFDYASARALRARHDPYDRLADLIDEIGGPAWHVDTANPHPPTMVALVLPATLLDYEHALVAWSLGMVLVLALTIRLVGVSWVYAIPVAIALACCWPAAYGIGNPVPLIGLGAALAFRYRERPWVAGLGLAFAAVPKLSGLLLAGAFLAALRWRPVVCAGAFVAVLGLVPVLLYPRTWSRYLDAGVDAIRVNADRVDNAALINAGTKLGVPAAITVVYVVAAAAIAAFVLRDLYWPSVWLLVALLPIAWMYSLLTLVPVVVYVILGRRPFATGLAIVATGVAVGSPSLGDWTIYTFPLVVALVLLALATSGRRGDGMWPERDRLPERVSGLLGRWLSPRDATVRPS